MLDTLFQTSWLKGFERRGPAFSPAYPEDERYMRLALYLARSADPSPNPPVGAVVAAQGRIVAVGHHACAGGAHAEIVALEDAGLLALGATLYVTLEPCNHHGRTPPCVNAILSSGIARVVFGCPDPNPHVRGGGAERLLRKGVRVARGVLQPRAESLIADWRRSLERPPARLSLPARRRPDADRRTQPSRSLQSPE